MPDETQTMEVLSADALGAMERSQVDMQVATAKKYPRSVGAFLKEAESMISLNHEIAEGCNYKLKRRNQDGSDKIIEGPSIRLMEIAASAWTNLTFGSRIIGIDQDFVTAQGVAIDIQKNIRVFVEVKRSIRGKHGRYSTDMIMVTANAAGSIARRNALLGGAIPRAYVNQLADFAKKHARGDAKSLPERLQAAFEYFKNVLGVDQAKVLAYLEKPTVADCSLEDLEMLQGLKTAIKEGDTTIDAEFTEEKPKAKEETPSIGGAAKPATPPAAAETKPATNIAPMPAPENPPAEKAPAKRTPKKKEEPPPTPPAPATPAPAPPANVETMADPPAAPPDAPAAPQFSQDDLGQMVADKLQEHGVSVDDFFDWLGSTSRDHKYQVALDTVGAITELPTKMLQDLCADGYKDLQACVKIYGKKK
jgi:hypothetical protein